MWQRNCQSEEWRYIHYIHMHRTHCMYHVGTCNEWCQQYGLIHSSIYMGELFPCLTFVMCDSVWCVKGDM